MTSSEWLQVEKWVAAKARIRASFIGNGIAVVSFGRLVFTEDRTKLWLVDDEGKPALAAFPNLCTPCERLEPLTDAPEEMRWKLDFFVAVAFRIPCGSLDLFEVGDVDTDDAPR